MSIVRYGSATLRQRVAAAYHLFHTWRSDYEQVNRVFNVTQTIAFLDHETESTLLLIDGSDNERFLGSVSIMVQEQEGFLRNRVPPEHWVCNVLVHPKHRQKGHATLLLQRAEDYLREKNVAEAHLWCEPSLESFYEKRGWKKEGEFRAKPGTVHMTKSL